MATYYRWRKSTVNYTKYKVSTSESRSTRQTTVKILEDGYEPQISSGNFVFPSAHVTTIDLTAHDDYGIRANYFMMGNSTTSNVVYYADGYVSVQYGHTSKNVTYYGSTTEYQLQASPSTSQGYVYSTSSSAYPNGGVSGSYYYDQRTTVTSPTKASNLTYPKTIDALTQTSIQLQWTGAQSNTDYPVTEYEVSYAINNTNSWQVAGTTGVLTYKFSNIPEEATSIAFRVRAKDSNNKYGDYVTGTYSTITRESPITVVTKNIEMNYFNGTDYEILYPVVGSEVYNHVKSGNYVGSGQYGQSNPNRIELEFTPKVAMITKTSGVYDTYLLNGKTVSYVQSSTGVSEITVEWTGQTVSWYSADSVEAQLNENGVLYVYTVFG